MIDPAEIAELRELEAKATPGPWALRCCNRHVAEGKRVTGCLSIREPSGMQIAGESDLLLAAAARNALPRLLDAAERCARLEEALAGVVELCAVFEKDALRGLARPLPRYIEGGYRDRLTHVRAIKEFVEALQPAAQLDAADSESREDEQRDDHDDGS